MHRVAAATRCVLLPSEHGGNAGGEAPRERCSGYTILELLTVIAIVAVLLGIGVGVFARLGKRNELEATTNAVKALLRRARNAAREERAPATVELEIHPPEAEGCSVVAQTREALVLFRFEQDQISGDATYAQAPDDQQKQKATTYSVTGSYSIRGSVYGADVTEGKLGQGLEFKRPGAFVSVPDRPSLSPIEGVAVEAWVFPDKLEDAIPQKPGEREPKTDEVERRIKACGDPPTPTPVRSQQTWSKNPDDPPLFTVARKGKAFEVAVTAGYAIQLAITGTDAHGRGGSTYVARTEDGALRAEKWARIGLAFDGRDFACTIDGIRHALVAVKGFENRPERLVRDRAPLVFSDPDPDRAFAGVLDEIKLSGILRSERVAIPKGIALLAPTTEISFDALGALDPLKHPEPVVFWLSDHEDALKLLEPPAGPEPGKTVERKKQEKPDDAKGATDRQKLEKFSELATRLPENRMRRIAVELTGIVPGDSPK